MCNCSKLQLQPIRKHQQSPRLPPPLHPCGLRLKSPHTRAPTILFILPTIHLHAAHSRLKLYHRIPTADQPVRLCTRARVGCDAANETRFACAQGEQRRGKIIGEVSERGVKGNVSVAKQPSIIGVACGTCQARPVMSSTDHNEQHMFTFANDEAAPPEQLHHIRRHVIERFGTRQKFVRLNADAMCEQTGANAAKELRACSRRFVVGECLGLCPGQVLMYVALKNVTDPNGTALAQQMH